MGQRYVKDSYVVYIYTLFFYYINVNMLLIHIWHNLTVDIEAAFIVS